VSVVANQTRLCNDDIGRDSAELLVANVDITVFAALRVVPETLRLIPGSIFQVGQKYYNGVSYTSFDVDICDWLIPHCIFLEPYCFFFFCFVLFLCFCVLFFFPNCLQQIPVFGGPPGTQTRLNFVSVHPHIVSVDHEGILHALDIGVSVVFVNASATSVYEACGASIVVVVSEPRSIMVSVPDVDVITGAVVNAFAVTDASDVAWAYHQNPSISFQWTISDLNILAPKQTVTSWECVLLAQSPGSVTISVIADVIGVDGVQYRLESKDVTMVVTEELRLLSPSALRMAPSASALVRTNFPPSHIRIVRLCGPAALIHIRETTLTAFEDSGEVTLRVEHVSSAQSVLITVAVTPPLYMTVDDAPKLALGSLRTVRVMFLDRFDQYLNGVRGIPLEAISNHGSSVWVAEPAEDDPEDAFLKVHLSAVAIGKAMVRLVAFNLTRFIETEVTDVMSPSSCVVHVGGEVFFTTQISSGTWDSSNRELFEIGVKSGHAAAAHDEGTGFVNLVASDITAKTSLTVSRVREMRAIRATPLTNAIASQPNHVTLIPYADLQKLVPFSRTASVKHHLVARCSVHDPVSGVDMGPCTVIDNGVDLEAIIYFAPPQDFSRPDFVHTVLSVVVSDIISSYSFNFTQILPFSSSFYIQPQFQSLYLSEASPVGVIRVDGNPRRVQVGLTSKVLEVTELDPCNSSATSTNELLGMDIICGYGYYRVSASSFSRGPAAVNVTFSTKGCISTACDSQTVTVYVTKYRLFAYIQAVSQNLASGIVLGIAITLGGIIFFSKQQNSRKPVERHYQPTYQFSHNPTSPFKRV
jgi:hypothetical protein